MMLHKFYPVVPDSSWVSRIVPLGVKTVQLRLKDAEDSEIKRQISVCLDVCARHNSQLIVNDYWRQALELRADYIHLGQEDLADADLPAIKAAGLKLGVSTHSHDELDVALEVEPTYVALGPVYETTLKKMKWAPQGLERLRDWKSKAPCPVVAIGGITLERAPAVFETGADSIAVVTDIVGNPSPEDRIMDWLKYTESVD